MPDIAEHRFDRGKPSSVTGFAFFAVDGPLHPVGVAFFRCVGFATKEGNLPNRCLLRRAQAFGALFAGLAIAQGAAVFRGEAAVVDAICAVAVELLARRAGANTGGWIKREILRPVTFGGFLRVRLVVERVWFGLVFALVFEAFIALAHAVVRNQCRNAFFGQRLEIGFGMVAGIGRVKRLRGGLGLRGAHDRQQ